MDTKSIASLIAGGENSTVEFKRDDARPDALAKEIVAFLNSHGGALLLGVEDNGRASGLVGATKKTEERILNICENNIEPAIIPEYSLAHIDGVRIAVVTLPYGSAHRPYRIKSTGKYYIRAGSVSRECSREELGRLFSTSPVGVTFENRPVINARFADLDIRRLRYYAKLRPFEAPEDDTEAAWRQLLVNRELLTEDSGEYLTVASTLLFTTQPWRLLKQAGITAVAYDGVGREAPALERQRLRQPLTPLWSGAIENHLVDPGLIEEALYFVKRNISVQEPQIDGRLEQIWDVPLDAVRETIINALTHRDYSLPSDIALEIFTDRIEITSPGTFINSMTIERMKSGVRAVRNQMLVDVISDYQYAESTGRGISRIVIPQMRKHNNTEPEFIIDEVRMITILRK